MTHEEQMFQSIKRQLRLGRAPVVGPTLSVLGAFSLPAGFIAWLLLGDWRWTLVGVALLLGFSIAAGAVNSRHK